MREHDERGRLARGGAGRTREQALERDAFRILPAHELCLAEAPAGGLRVELRDDVQLPAGDVEDRDLQWLLRRRGQTGDPPARGIRQQGPQHDAVGCADLGRGRAIERKPHEP